MNEVGNAIIRDKSRAIMSLASNLEAVSTKLFSFAHSLEKQPHELERIKIMLLIEYAEAEIKRTRSVCSDNREAETNGKV